MSNQIFHFSNTGISSGQRFILKENVSGIFLNKLNINSDSSAKFENINIANTSSLPLYSYSSGVSGQIAFDNNFFYRHNGINWTRTAMSIW
jgi:hypothetical protein